MGQRRGSKIEEDLRNDLLIPSLKSPRYISQEDPLQILIPD